MPENPATDLRIKIVETAEGTINVEWQMTTDKGILISPRLSHVLGQLYAAAHIIAVQGYGDIAESNSSSKGKTGGKDKKVSTSS